MTVEPRSDTRRVSRAGYGLSAAGAAATLLFFAPSSDAIQFVKVSLPVVAVLLFLALVGLLGARLGRSVLFLLAGGIGLIASILQLVQFGGSTNWLGGNGSSAAFLAGLGIGFCALWYAALDSHVPRAAPSSERA